ncbi:MULTISPECIES: DUF4168 domain-containing protein [unclassified Roseofilum]|uniref:DUF4168 domain-containing protein n=1 Tax=unclassified Roseofilum TaxID=2620099 RepID=UPI000E89FF18|nr:MULTISPECIES: DUF4168 domain-containing protein [unclassified Roseofilum]HBR00853.1 hypothetical protein [Cyanobacteria bacterium UBA11691]MBP0008957.1 DUF4168 domain-containing protein [Roseofilum sp. Belize Diploria]MBP0014245.1 DUF4168 domain-containing protein [Roseofilum sp. SID3]MBP0023766.1 DUF4168 domain-containing protein [Roseofilum sp. SID2]MBP0032817.1 DUF4168 domain-containing protein [Roseofilum sp. Belize BBD 4]
MNHSFNFQVQLRSSGGFCLDCPWIGRTLIASVLSLCGSLAGASTAQAQFNSPVQMANFVQSVLEIELARETTLQNTQGLVPIGNKPIFDCNLEAGTVSNTTGISQDIISHLQSFCSQSQTVLQQHNLSPEEFHKMRVMYGQNPQQYPQITQSFQQLCQNNRYSELQICR